MRRRERAACDSTVSPALCKGKDTAGGSQPELQRSDVACDGGRGGKVQVIEAKAEVGAGARLRGYLKNEILHRWRLARKAVCSTT